jgi:uncharacterized membrane protein
MDGTNGTAPQGAPTNGQMPAGGFPAGGHTGNFPGGRGGAISFLGPFGGIVGIVLLVLTYVVLAVAFWKFLSKAGLTPAIALLMLVPVVNLGVALWATFTEWPALREVNRLREQVATYEMRAAQTAQAAAAENGAPTPMAPA